MSILRYLLILSLVIGTFFLANKASREAGVREGELKCQEKTIAQLTAFIESTEQLTADANTASLALSKTISDRIVADAKTTRDIRDALKTTAHLRVDCVLPDSVMQQLNTARHRANETAAAGIDSAVPTAAGAN